jgi:mycothiol synthase
MTIPGLPALPGGDLDWRPMTAADIDGWYQLIQRMAAVDKPVWTETTADLADAFDDPANDPAETTLIGLDEDGTVRAVGRVYANPGSAVAHTWGGVDPQWRRRGIGRALYAWQAGRQRSRFAAAGISGGVLRTSTEEQDPAHNALMAAADAAVVRYFTEMTRPLETIPEAPLPDGFTFVDLAPEDSEAVRLAHNEAFADHWGSEPRDERRWRTLVLHPETKPEWSMSVVETSSGETVAYQVASFDPAYKLQSGYDEGFTNLLGVRRPWRGRGLAQSLLAEAMRRFKGDGMAHAGLGVDTENPSGALGLYTRMGYVPTKRYLDYELPLT